MNLLVRITNKTEYLKFVQQQYVLDVPYQKILDQIWLGPKKNTTFSRIFFTNIYYNMPTINPIFIDLL